MKHLPRNAGQDRHMARRAIRHLVALLVLSLAGPAWATQVPQYAEFRDWVLGCDNLRRCEARGFTDASPYAELRITREAGAAMPELRLLAADRAAVPVPLLDGAPLQAWPQGWRMEVVDGNAAATTRDPATIAGFIAQARAATTLDFGDGPQAVPLSGLLASLLRMDELQGRIGTATPLAAPVGPVRTPLALPPPRRPPWVRQALGQAEAAALLAATRHDGAAALRDAECERDKSGIPPDEIHALDSRTAVVLLGCGSAAYQDWSLAYLVTRTGRRVTLLRLPLPSLRGNEAVLMNGGFDPRTGLLGFMNKGRGIADCGTSAAWAWGGGRFRLVALNRLDRCGGEPGDWLTLYRTAP